MDKFYQILIGKKIKSIRESKKLSREDVAYEAGISSSYVGMIERGEYDFKISKLFAIANAMSISPEEIIKDL